MIDYVEKLIKKEFGNAFRRTINFYYKNDGDWVVEFMADTEDYRTVFYVVQGYENKILETDTYGDSGDSANVFLSYVKDLVKSF